MVLMGYALFIFVTITLALKWLKEQTFRSGYWAYTFGIATLSPGTFLYFALRNEADAVFYIGFDYFWFDEYCSFGVTIGSVKLVIKRKLFFPK